MSCAVSMASHSAVRIMRVLLDGSECALLQSRPCGDGRHVLGSRPS